MARWCPLLPETWKKELKDLASHVAIFTKENELKSKEVGAAQRRGPERDEMHPPLCNEIPPTLRFNLNSSGTKARVLL